MLFSHIKSQDLNNYRTFLQNILLNFKKIISVKSFFYKVESNLKLLKTFIKILLTFAEWTQSGPLDSIFNHLF